MNEFYELRSAYCFLFPHLYMLFLLYSYGITMLQQVSNYIGFLTTHLFYTNDEIGTMLKPGSQRQIQLCTYLNEFNEIEKSMKICHNCLLSGTPENPTEAGSLLMQVTKKLQGKRNLG